MASKSTSLLQKLASLNIPKSEVGRQLNGLSLKVKRRVIFELWKRPDIMRYHHEYMEIHGKGAERPYLP